MTVSEYLKGCDRKRFCHVVSVDAKKLVFRPEYRKFCEENLCGNYNANYSCPPFCGTAEEMISRARGKENCLVLATKHPVRDACDGEEIAPLKLAHNADSRLFVRELCRATGIEKPLVMLAGNCTLCNPCKMRSGEPCAYSSERCSCASAYCLDMTELCRQAGIDITWDRNEVTLFTVILW